MPAAAIEIVRDVIETRPTVSLHQAGQAFQLLADGIFASREEIDRQIGADLRKRCGKGEPGSRGKKGSERGRLKLRKAERSSRACSALWNSGPGHG